MKKSILFILCFFTLYTVFSQPDIAGVPGSREVLRVQDGHTDTIKEVIFSPNSRYIGTAGDDFTVCIWDIKQDRLIGTFPLFKKITGLCFSPDNNYFAVITEDRILLWDIRNNRSSFPNLSDKFSFTSVAFTEDSTNLIIAGLGRNVYFINVASLEVSQVLHDEEDTYNQITYVTLSPDRKHIAAAGAKTVKRTVWRILTKNIETGALTAYEVAKHNGWIQNLSYSQDATLLLSAAYDGRVNFYSTVQGIEYLTTINGSPVNPAAHFFPGKNDMFAYLDEEGLIRTGILSKEEDAYSSSLDIKRAGTIGKPGASAFAFSPDGIYIAASYGNQLIIRDSRSFEVVKSYSGLRETFYSAAFSPDGTKAATGGKNIMLWDCSTGKLIRKIENSHDMIYKKLHFVKNSTLIAGKETFEGELFRAGIDIFNLETGNAAPLPTGTATAFSAYKVYNKDYIAFSEVQYGEETLKYVVKVLETESNKSIVLAECDSRINAIACSGNGKFVAGGLIDGTIRFWNIAERKLDFTLDRSNGPIIALCLSPDGKYLASSDSTGMFYLWDVKKKSLLKEEKKSSPFTSLFFSPDGKRIIAGGNRAAYNIACDRKSKEVILSGHSSAVYMGQFSPDGKKIITVSKDGTLKWWQGSEARLLATALVFPDSYLIYSPAGYYYTPDTNSELISWYYNRLFLKESIRDSMKRPDIIKQVLAGIKFAVPEKEFEKITKKYTHERYADALTDEKGPLYTDTIETYGTMNEYNKKYAILIGISDYEELTLETRRADLLDLKYAHKDALAFEQFLKDQKELGSGEWDITCITNEEATNAKLDNTLSRVLTDAKENDLIFIFFSGHARKHPSTNDLYLLTYDFDPNYYRDGYDYRDMNRLIKESKARYIITFIDACFSGHPGGAKGEKDPLLHSINALQLPENKVIIASSRGEELSFEDDKIKQGVFTYYLLKGLNGYAKETNNNRYVEIQELISYLEKEIPAHARKEFKREQHPYEFGVKSEIRYNFPLAVRAR